MDEKNNYSNRTPCITTSEAYIDHGSTQHCVPITNPPLSIPSPCRRPPLLPPVPQPAATNPSSFIYRRFVVSCFEFKRGTPALPALLQRVPLPQRTVCLWLHVYNALQENISFATRDPRLVALRCCLCLPRSSGLQRALFQGMPHIISPSRVHSPFENSGALKADRSAGFLFPFLPVLQADLSEDGGDVSADSSGDQHKMTCGQFVLVTFFIVAGGPTGIETVVSSGGPFYAFIGLLIIPWLWFNPPTPPHTAPLSPTHAPHSLHPFPPAPFPPPAGVYPSLSCPLSLHALSPEMAAPFDTSNVALEGAHHQPAIFWSSMHDRTSLLTSP